MMIDPQSANQESLLAAKLNQYVLQALAELISQHPFDDGIPDELPNLNTENLTSRKRKLSTSTQFTTAFQITESYFHPVVPATERLSTNTVILTDKMTSTLMVEAGQQGFHARGGLTTLEHCCL